MKSKLLLCLVILLGSIAVLAQNDKAKTLHNQEKATDHGTDPWEALSADEFRRLIADSSVLVIDVRTPGFDKAADQLDRKKPLAVYCRSGVRSRTAAAILLRKGFRVVELEEGISSWTGKLEK